MNRSTTSSNSIEDKLYAATRMPNPRPEFLAGLRTRLAEEAKTDQGTLPPISLIDRIKITFQRPAWVIVIIVLILALTGIVLLPQKEALADAWKHFFRPKSAEEFPIPSAAELATPTNPPAFAVTLAPSAEAQATTTPLPTPMNTSQPSSSPCAADPYRYACKIAKAEKRAGFDAKELPADPQGFAFKDVIKAEPGEIMIEYDVIGGGGYLYLNQGTGSEFPSFTGSAPESAIEEVQVGEYRGEYVAGSWVIGGKNTKYTWGPSGRFRLRWVEGDRWFEIDKEAALPSTDYMTKEVMIQMATGLVNAPAPDQGPRADYLVSYEEASQLAEFEIVTPTVLPDGFNFSFGSYAKDLSQLKLEYDPAGDPAPGLARIYIVETPLDKVSLDHKENGEDLKGEKVEVNGFTGIYSTGGPYNHTLSWQNGKIKITLSIISSEGYGGSFTKDQVLEIGRSMK